jgi:Flp pilus assembly protein TadD
MIRSILPALLLASVAAPLPAAAQASVQAVPGTTTADRLAGEMRLLASNANDLNALLGAGELSLQLEDLGAAASFFARAEKVDPHNGRVKAGQGAILVHAERPGEALRYFATAERFGLPAAAFASDRGLAYDLIGEQDRAQRDYRLALRAAGTQNTDETLRRYALSLGISGKRDLAEQELQPLLRKQDRGAWRTRAFVEAMTGNLAEANHIAVTMMPPGTAAGLQPFFVRLAGLGAIDRAFAVHFGEVRASPQRLADARLAPPLPALGADPYAPRPVAVAAASAPAAADKGKRKKGKQAVAVATSAPQPQPQPQPQAPAYAATGGVRAVVPAVAANPPSRGVVVPATSTPARPVVLAATPMTVVRAGASPAPLPMPPAERDVRVAAAPIAAVPTRSTPTAASLPSLNPAPPPVVSVASAATLPPVPVSPPPVLLASAEPPRRGGSPAAWPTAINPATPPASPSAHAAAPVLDETPVAAAVPAPVPRLRAARRDARASIVGGLPIPAAELGVEGPRRAEPAAAAAVTEAAPAPDPAAIAASQRAAAAKALAEKRAADRKAAAEKKALAEKKAAAEQKATEAREAAAQKKLERANPERIWVQVAGGAYEGDLPKAWAAAKKKGGDVFAGHASGYTTPLRFTNRVLAGPFKTDEEARSFINKLRAKGMAGFTFTSDAGQVVKKLGSDE